MRHMPQHESPARKLMCSINKPRDRPVLWQEAQNKVTVFQQLLSFQEHRQG